MTREEWTKTQSIAAQDADMGFETTCLNCGDVGGPLCKKCQRTPPIEASTPRRRLYDYPKLAKIDMRISGLNALRGHLTNGDMLIWSVLDNITKEADGLFFDLASAKADDREESTCAACGSISDCGCSDPGRGCPGPLERI